MQATERRIMDLIERRLMESSRQTQGSIDQFLREVDMQLEDMNTALAEGAFTQGMVEDDASAGATTSLGETLNFVACVNGRALYRDQSGSTFFSEVMDALENSRCDG